MKKRFSVLSTLCAPLFKYYVSQLIFAFHEKLKVFFVCENSTRKSAKIVEWFFSCLQIPRTSWCTVQLYWQLWAILSL